MLISRFVLVLVIFSMFVGKASSSQVDEQDERLEKLLSRFPEADANKDGKLTIDETRKFLQKKKSTKQTGSSPAEKPAQPSKESTPSTEPSASANEPKANSRAAKKARRGDAPPPDHADVSYGSHPNNRLDLWLARSDRPTPLVVLIHGGGFVGGDKTSASGAAIKQCLEAGVSFASINYRYRTEASINVVLRDTARAIQFLRHKAQEYNFDKTRVGAFGGSAGAGASLWLAFRDDLADPQSDDPVLQESSRLSAAASSAGQASYDILKWRDVLGSDEAMRFYPESTWPAFYGLKTLADLQTEEGKKLRADVDMLGLITPDDPPVWLGAGAGHDALANKGDTNHSPKHSEALKRRCDEVGVKAELRIGDLKRDGVAAGTPVEFLLKHLNNRK